MKKQIKKQKKKFKTFEVQVVTTANVLVMSDSLEQAKKQALDLVKAVEAKQDTVLVSSEVGKVTVLSEFEF